MNLNCASCPGSFLMNFGVVGGSVLIAVGIGAVIFMALGALSTITQGYEQVKRPAAAPCGPSRNCLYTGMNTLEQSYETRSATASERRNVIVVHSQTREEWERERGYQTYQDVPAREAAQTKTTGNDWFRQVELAPAETGPLPSDNPVHPYNPWETEIEKAFRRAKDVPEEDPMPEPVEASSKRGSFTSTTDANGITTMRGKNLPPIDYGSRSDNIEF